MTALSDGVPRAAAGAPVFVCRRCGVCCRGWGGVRLGEAGARVAAEHLGLTPGEFRRLYLAPGRPPWDIRLDEAGRCLCLRPDGRCLIHPVKPEICGRWPFLPALLSRPGAFEEARCACPGFRAGLNWAEFRAARPRP